MRVVSIGREGGEPILHFVIMNLKIALLVLSIATAKIFRRIRLEFVDFSTDH